MRKNVLPRKGHARRVFAFEKRSSVFFASSRSVSDHFFSPLINGATCGWRLAERVANARNHESRGPPDGIQFVGQTM